MKIYKSMFLGMSMMLSLSSIVSALDIKATLGLHDNYIPGREHHTLAVGIGFYAEHESKSNIKSSAYLDWFFDEDKEEVDYDRDSNWFQAGFNITGPDIRYSDSLYINFALDGDMRYNTVSSIEAYYKIFPGIIAEYRKQNYLVGLGLYGGYYYFEEDDDLPKAVNYPYLEAKYESAAYSLKCNTLISLNEFFELSAVAQQWRDDNIWLQDRVVVDLIYNMSNLIPNSEFIISSEYNHYERFKKVVNNLYR